MRKRSNLELEVAFYDSGDVDSYDGPEPTLIGSSPALVSFGGASYDATRASEPLSAATAQGYRDGKIRVFLREIPEGVKEADWLQIPSMGAEFYTIMSMDKRGVLPGRYPMRLEAEAN